MRRASHAPARPARGCGPDRAAPDSHDRHGSRVALTSRARETADRALEDIVAVENTMFATLSPTERDPLDRMLDKLLAAFDTRD